MTPALSGACILCNPDSGPELCAFHRDFGACLPESDVEPLVLVPARYLVYARLDPVAVLAGAFRKRMGETLSKSDLQAIKRAVSTAVLQHYAEKPNERNRAIALGFYRTHGNLRTARSRLRKARSVTERGKAGASVTESTSTPRKHLETKRMTS